MASKKSRTSAARRTVQHLRKKLRGAGEFCSVDLTHGQAFTVEQLVARESPRHPAAAFRTARQFKRNFFVGFVLAVKASVLNHGLTLEPRDKARRKDFAAWLAEKPADLERGTHQMLGEKYVGTATDEFLLQDNLVSFWRDDEIPYPIECERCDYKDVMGRELLKVRVGYGAEDLKAAGFSPAEVKRYSSGVITVGEGAGSEDENFLVLTRAPSGKLGSGFGYPRLTELFYACSQAESMEVGESLLAYAGRTVIRMHHLGWEVKRDSGVRQVEAMWDRERAEEIESFFKGLQGGVAETSGNFDHKISYVVPDAKLFDPKKWESFVTRAQWWGGPLVFLLLSRTLNPSLMPLFKAEIHDLRRLLQPHLEYVLNAALRPPGGLKLTWSDQCFADLRLLWDMIKTHMQQGSGSLATGLRFAGLNPEAEGEQKVAEHDDPQAAKKFAPYFDAAHGNRPGAPGRTPGVRDGEGKGTTR